MPGSHSREGGTPNPGELGLDEEELDGKNESEEEKKNKKRNIFR